MRFTEIKGQDRAVGIIARALAHDALAHAYLFSGDAGVGKMTTALALAAAVHCTARGEEGGCGECPACRKVAAASHPDVHVLAADGEEIKIDQIRQVQADLALRPFEGVKKVLIIDGAESLNTAAANAFLKTLEEPPGDALLVLITAMPQALLDTIRSRCQEIRFLPLPRAVLAHELEEKRGLSTEDARFLAALANGSLGRGLAMDLREEREERDRVRQLLAGLEQLDDGELLSLAEQYAKDRERFARLLTVGIECLRDALVLHETGDEALLAQPAASREWGERATVGRLLFDADLLVLGRTMLERRVSAQLVAEDLFFRLARTGQGTMKTI